MRAATLARICRGEGGARICRDPGVAPVHAIPTATSRVPASELRHSFVSLLSSSGVPIEDISRLVGHVGTNVTEKVYRHEL
ncbi:hypothetical protein OHA18_27285 [Kribbella sp. NBC_00709]|uniref:hypothetical protein n=1 Tax=Kribbella sp. NBC_00709 TaxID=2975972 RepID=UPI002E2BE4A7|nr:hypothetical protein [Kribbella sp. NBC_00709]